MSLLSANSATRSIPDFNASAKQNDYQSDSSSPGAQSFDEIYAKAHASREDGRQNSSHEKSQQPGGRTAKSEASTVPEKNLPPEKSSETTDVAVEAGIVEEIDVNDEMTDVLMASELDSQEQPQLHDDRSTEEILQDLGLESQNSDPSNQTESVKNSESKLQQDQSSKVEDEILEQLSDATGSISPEINPETAVIPVSDTLNTDEIEDDEKPDLADDESSAETILTALVPPQQVADPAKTAMAAASAETDTETEEPVLSLGTLDSAVKSDVSTAISEAKSENSGDIVLEVASNPDSVELTSTGADHFKLLDSQSQSANANQPNQSAVDGLDKKPVEMSIAKPVTEPDWGDKVLDRIRWMANAQQQKAEIRLDPSDLGPLKVEVSIKNDHAQVTMTSHSSQVREILDQHLPRLREALESQGFQSVNAQTQGGQQQQQSDRQAAPNQKMAELVTGEDEMTESSIVMENAGKGRVDCYI